MTILIKVISNSNVVASKIIKQFSDGIANIFLRVWIFHITFVVLEYQIFSSDEYKTEIIIPLSSPIYYVYY